MEKESLLSQIAENVGFVLTFAGIVLAFILIAYGVEKLTKPKSDTERVLSTRKVVVTGVFSAIATVLFLFDFSVPFAPSFYKLDLSEVPAIIAGFAYGPVAGVMVEFIKIALKLIIKGTDTAFVGELANFVVGCSLILPATIIYRIKKSKTTAIISLIVGTIVITVVGSTFNALYLLPAFAKLYGMPLDVIIGMGAEINKSVTNVWNFALICVAPINLVKGLIVSVITMLIYKPLHPILKQDKHQAQ
ncbi:MAG: ECF transporter S component [Lachnospiraceae bacterium]|nr:ECF transporter S component [Lachnospiraceae bacterium]